MRKKQYLAIAFLLLLIVVQFVYYAIVLPDRVPQHFDASGTPDSWTTKWESLAIVLIVYLITVVTLVPVVVLARCLEKHFWLDSLLNLPNKQYWLSPERRNETMRYMHEAILWIAIATLALLIGVMQFVLMGSRENVQHFSVTGFLIVMGVYLAYMAVWCVQFYRRFSLKAQKVNE